MTYEVLSKAIHYILGKGFIFGMSVHKKHRYYVKMYSYNFSNYFWNNWYLSMVTQTHTHHTHAHIEGKKRK